MDALPRTSLTTGVTAQNLNGGNDYSLSSKAGALIEVIPDVSSTAAHTAGESYMIRSMTTSDSITSITPKEFIFSGAMGGLGTFPVTISPMLEARVFNTALRYATNKLKFQGEAQVANAVAPEMTLGLVFTEGGPLAREKFYEAPDNETSTGTTAGEVAGNDITINGGRRIIAANSIVTPGTVTASEDIASRGFLKSTNFDGPPSPQTWPNPTIAVGLGTAIGVAIPKDAWWKVEIPIESSFVANTGLNLDEDLTAAGNFIVQVMYEK